MYSLVPGDAEPSRSPGVLTLPWACCAWAGFSRPSRMLKFTWRFLGLRLAGCPPALTEEILPPVLAPFADFRGVRWTWTLIFEQTPSSATNRAIGRHFTWQPATNQSIGRHFSVREALPMSPNQLICRRSVPLVGIGALRAGFRCFELFSYGSRWSCS